MDTRENKIEQLLSRNIAEVIDREHIRAALRDKKKLRVKLGIDPTSPDLHLGHAVVLSKLREFQDLGCVAVLLIGDFTAQIGDPSGRDKTRPPLTADDVNENMKHYLKQAGKILDLKKTEVVYNSSWLSKLNAVETLKLLSKVTVQQIIEREDFDRRLSEQKSIQMHELIYPVLVAYDSVAMKADVEMGGSDQYFNFLMGRALMERFDMKPQDILTTPLLVGLDGERKMSKSLGNYIGLDDEPNNMFGKVMSLRDESIPMYFEFATAASEEDIADIRKELKKGTNPKILKERLAFEIVERYHGKAAAKKAQENFEKLFSRREVSDDVPTLKIKVKKISAIELVVTTGVLKSKSEARRLIEQGGFEFNEKNIKKPLEEIAIKGGEIVRVGKKNFFKIVSG